MSAAKARGESRHAASIRALELVAGKMPRPLVVVEDERAEIVFANASAGVLFGTPERRLVGTDLRTAVAETSRHVMTFLNLCRDSVDPQPTVMRVQPTWEKETACVCEGWVLTQQATDGPALIAIEFVRGTPVEGIARSRELAESDLRQVATILSHDFRSPLGAIRFFAERLRARVDDSDEETGKLFDMLLGAASSLSAMVADIVRYTRVERQGVWSDAVDLEATLEDVLSALAEAIESAGATIQRHNALPKVVGNRELMALLFHNLLDNALKYRSEKPPRIEIAYRSTKDSHVISIKDDGIGIPARFHRDIFNLFRRLHPPGEYSGTGVGLAVAKRVVGLHRGRLRVESDEGEGTTFIISLPLEAER